MRQLLADMGLGPFRLDEVIEYLDRQYGIPKEGRGAHWIWRPLRDADQSFHGQHNGKNTDKCSAYDANGSIGLNAHVYKKIVPLPVLLTVERIASAFPSASFYVSDQYDNAGAVLDPFLLVTLTTLNEEAGYRNRTTSDDLLVIEQWDEPGWRGQRE